MRRLRTAALVLSALLCTLSRTDASRTSSSSSSSPSPPGAASPSQMRRPEEERHRRIRLSHRQGSRPPPSSSPSSSSSSSSSSPSSSSSELKEVRGHGSAFPSATGRGAVPTVTSQTSDGAWERLPAEVGASPHCAYRVVEGGAGGPLCFRDTLSGFRCAAPDCRSVVSRGGVVANLLVNGSVLLQWSLPGESDTAAAPGAGTEGRGAGGGAATPPGEGRRRRRGPGGFELSCRWNGSYTQFECAGVHLGSGCRDFLLTQLHESIPYRLCLRPLWRAQARDCLEFTLPSSGMQDIVIAMTTVGGAICVMLVIICLLVAYITENIMSPAAQHSHPYRAHSRH